MIKKHSKTTKLLLIILSAIIASFLFSRFVMSVAWVYGGSMEPTYKNGDVVLVNRTSNALLTLDVGDVVVFHNYNVSTHTMIKRIVALPGDTVEIKDGALIVNGELKTLELNSELEDMSPIKIDSGCYFLLGDNPQKSMDSRNPLFGTVKLDDIMGKVIFKLF